MRILNQANRLVKDFLPKWEVWQGTLAFRVRADILVGASAESNVYSIHQIMRDDALIHRLRASIIQIRNRVIRELPEPIQSQAAGERIRLRVSQDSGAIQLERAI